jgi:hypothetical protein
VGCLEILAANLSRPLSRDGIRLVGQFQDSPPSPCSVHRRGNEPAHAWGATVECSLRGFRRIPGRLPWKCRARSSWLQEQ